MYNLINGNCLIELKKMDDDCIDSMVTDPPYGYKFMSKSWDDDCPSVEIWIECLRVLKPGGHLLSFSGTRTVDLIMGRIREAGFEIRDMISWLYGSGFPKSHNLKDKWQGWGTALKPACEPIVLARKPFKGTCVKNVLEHGTGAMNIDACRVKGKLDGDPNRFNKAFSMGDGHEGYKRKAHEGYERPIVRNEGRWPANVILDEKAGEMLDEQSGILKSGDLKPGHKRGDGCNIKYGGGGIIRSTYGGDKGGASRFFYCAKASKRERGEDNVHPTVKPIKLMEYLIKLVTPPNGIVLDPFMGSGSTGVAIKNLNDLFAQYRFIGIEIDWEYFEIAKQRIKNDCL